MQTDEFWAGEFGDEYTKRQHSMVVNNQEFFGKALDCAESIDSIVEFGAGTGMNIAALHHEYPHIEFTAIEINSTAAQEIPYAQVYCGSIFDLKGVSPKADLALTKGFLIHIPPENIFRAYDIIYNSTEKYILMCEYYNPTPVEVEYRGHQGKLWKRDFAGEILDRYPELQLIDYGFQYHRDKYPQDDLTWFLLEKK